MNKPDWLAETLAELDNLTGSEIRGNEDFEGPPHPTALEAARSLLHDHDWTGLPKPQLFCLPDHDVEILFNTPEWEMWWTVCVDGTANVLISHKQALEDRYFGEEWIPEVMTPYGDQWRETVARTIGYFLGISEERKDL